MSTLSIGLSGTFQGVFISIGSRRSIGLAGSLFLGDTPTPSPPPGHKSLGTKFHREFQYEAGWKAAARRLATPESVLAPVALPAKRRTRFPESGFQPILHHRIADVSQVQPAPPGGFRPYPQPPELREPPWHPQHPRRYTDPTIAQPSTPENRPRLLRPPELAWHPLQRRAFGIPTTPIVPAPIRPWVFRFDPPVWVPLRRRFLDPASSPSVAIPFRARRVPLWFFDGVWRPNPYNHKPFGPIPPPTPPGRSTDISIQIPDPRFMDWDFWSSQTIDRLRGIGMFIVPEREWRDWARYVVSALPLNEIRVSDPDGFDSWQEWAYALVVASAGGL